MGGSSEYDWDNFSMIDQTNRAVKTRRCQSGGSGELGDGLQGNRVDELEVVDGKISRGVAEKMGFCGVEINCGRLFTGLDEISGGGEGALDAWSVGAVFWSKFTISGRKGEPVGFADGRVADNFDRNVQIADHTINEGELLEVFFAKNGTVGLEDVEQFQDDGENALEMPGAGGSAEVFGEAGFCDENGAIGEIEFVGMGDEGEIDAFGFAGGEVIFKSLGVVKEVPGAVELDWIHENRDRGRAPGADFFTRRMEQGEVSFVERSHCRDEGEGTRSGRKRFPNRGNIVAAADHRGQSCALRLFFSSLVLAKLGEEAISGLLVFNR